MKSFKYYYSNSIIYILLIILNSNSSFLYSQSIENKLKTNRNIIGFIPSKYHRINGIAIGFVGSEVYCDYKISKVSNGLNLQLGQGILLLPMLFYDVSYLNKESKHFIDSLIYSQDTAYYKAKHNGLLLSIFGSGTDIINGLTLSSIFSIHKKTNGVSISVFGNLNYTLNGVAISVINKSVKARGLQIGFYNSATELKGLQIGLINRNRNRVLPIVNW